MSNQQETEFCTFISYNKEVFLNNKIQMIFPSVYTTKLYNSILNERSTTFPINEFISKKRESDLVYQHPEIRSKADIKVRDEYSNLQVDFINKWYENFEFQSLIISSLAEQIYTNALKTPNSLEDEFNQTKESIRAQYDTILNNTQLQVNSVLIKTYANNFLQSMNSTLQNGLLYSELIKETLTLVLFPNYQMIFYLKNEINSSIDLITKKFKEHSSNEDEQLIILQILFNISLGFQSLYGLLVLVKLIKTSKLESKHRFDQKSLCQLNKIVSENSHIPLIDITPLSNSSATLQLPEASFKQTTAALASDNILLLHNHSYGLIKFIILQNKELSFSQVNSCNNQSLFPYINTQCALFVYDKLFGFLFSFHHFKQEDSLMNLLTLFNASTLKPFEGKCINYSYDDLTKRILFENEPNGLFKDHYIKYIKGQCDIFQQTNKTSTLSYSSDTVAVCFEDHLLYILHPIYLLIDYSEKKANTYIYGLDVIDLSYKKEINTIQFTHYNTHVFNWKPIDKTKPYIADIFTKNKTLNRFIVMNGQVISFEGDLLLNTKEGIGNDPIPLFKLSPISMKAKMSLPIRENGLFISYKDKALLIDLDTQNANAIELNYYSYRFSSYEIHNELFKTRKVRQNDAMITSKAAGSEAFDDLFMTNIFNTESKEKVLPKDSIRINNHNENSTQLILQTLCDCIDYKQYMTIKSTKIDQWIKAPYILSIDSYTIEILLDLIKANYDNEYMILMISKLFLNQINQMTHNKAITQILFASTESTEQYLTQLLHIQKSSSSIQIKKLLSIILIKLLKISIVSKEVYNSTLISILPHIYEKTIHFAINNQEALYEFIALLVFSKKQFTQITSNAQLFDYLFSLFSIILEEEEQYCSNVNYIAFTDNIINDFFTIFALLLSDEKFIDQFSRLAYFLFSHIKAKILFLVKQRFSFSVSLFHFILMIIISNSALLTHSFIFKNIAILIEIIISLSSLKPVLQLDPSMCFDIIFDNYSSFEDIKKSVSFKYPSSLTSPETKSNDKDKDKAKSNTLPNKIYIEAIVIRKEPLKGKTKLLELQKMGNAGMFETIYIEGPSSRSTYSIEADLYNGIELYFNSTIPNALIKIRVSNYEFYSEDIDYILQPSVETLNIMIKKLMFYSNDIDTDTKLYNLFSTRLFSQGIINNLSKNKLNEDLDAFIDSIKQTSEYYTNYLFRSIDHLKEDKPSLTIEEANSSHSQFIQLNDLNNTEEYNTTLNQFNSQLNIIIKGDIPDKLVKCAYYIILHHENILNEMLPKNIEGSRKELFLIWKECSDLRKVYKEIKDKLIQENKDITEGFDDIFTKMAFLFNLQPEKKESLLQSNFRKRKDSITTTISLPRTQIIKDHLNNITQIIKNTLFTIENIKNGYEEINTKVKFREIAIQILIDLLSRVTDKEVVCNLLTRFYSNFISVNKTIPSIYMSMKSINERTGESLTLAFHDLLNAIITKLESSKLTKFEQSIMLNCLIWKIKKRNFPFFEDSQLLSLISNDDHLLDANTFLYFIPSTKNKASNCFYYNYSELRPIDDCHLGKLLTDIFSYYTQKILKLEINSSQANSNIQARKLDELKLARMKSYNKQEAFQNIIEIIIQVYEQQFEKILEVFKQTQQEPLKNNEDEHLIFPTDSNLIPDILKQTIQVKLYNLLNCLIKNIIIQYTKGDFYFNYHSLWSIIVSQLKYADYKNSRLIISLLEYFSQVQQDNMKLFYDKITSSKISNAEYSSSLLFDYLFNISKYKELICSFLLFWLRNIDEKEVVSYVNSKIINESAINMLDVYKCSITNLTYFKKILINSSLGLELKEIYNYRSNKQDNDIFIKKGYSLIEPASIIQSSHKDFNVEESKEEPDKNNNDDDNNDGNDDGNDDDDESDDNESDGNESYENQDQNGSYINTSDSHNSRNSEKGTNELMFFESFNIPITRNQPVILNDIEEMRLNSLNVNENEIINIEDSSIDFNRDLIKKIIEYINENLFKNNSISVDLMMNYMRILICLSKESNQSNNEVKELIQAFIKDNKANIDRLIYKVYEPLSFSVLSPLKVEAYFNSIAAVCSENERNKIYSEKSNVNDNTAANDNANDIEKKCCCKGSINENKDMISFYLKSDSCNKLNIPVNDYSNINFFEKKSSDYDICVLNLEEYEKMNACYKELASNEGKKKNEDENEKDMNDLFGEDDMEEARKNNEINEEEGETKQKEEEIKKTKEQTKKSNKDNKKIEAEIIKRKLEIKSLKENAFIFLCEEVIQHLGVNDKNQIDKEKTFLSNSKKNKALSKEKEKEKNQSMGQKKKEKDDCQLSSIPEYDLTDLFGFEENDKEENEEEEEEEEEEKDLKEDKNEINEENKEEEINEENKEAEINEENKEEINEENKEEINEENKDKEQEENFFDLFFGDTPTIQETKENAPTEDKGFTTPSWEVFTKTILNQYDLKTCVFLIKDTYYHKIPKKFHSYSYSSTLIPSESLTSSIVLQAYLKEKIIDKTSKCNNIQIKEIENIAPNKKSDLFNQLDKIDASKNEDKSKDKDKNIITIKSRMLTPGITFNDLYRTFPSINSLKSKPSFDIIISTGYALLKYHFIHLQVMNSFLSDIILFQYIFNSAYYYKECFNLTDDYDKMVRMLPDLMASIPLDSFLNDKDIVCLNYLSSNIASNNSILDIFLLELIKLYGNSNDEANLSLLLFFIIKKNEQYLRGEHFEQTLITFKLLIELLHHIKSQSTIDAFIHSVLVLSLEETIDSHENKNIQYYYIKIMEFLYQIMQILKDNKLINEDDKGAFYNKSSWKAIIRHIDIINNKFKSESLVNSLITEDSQFKEKLKTQLSLPIELDAYAIRLQDQKLSLKIMKDDWKDSIIYLGQDNDANKIVTYPLTNIIKDTTVKDTLIIKQKSNDEVYSSILYNIKKKEIIKDTNSLLQGSQANILFTDFYQLNSQIIVGKDKYGKYYYCGKFNKSTKTKQNRFLPFDELNNIAQSSQYITQISNSLIITDNTVYYIKEKDADMPDWLISHNSPMYKLSFSIDAKFIGGHFNNQKLVLWTEEGHLYGIGRNNSNELSIGNTYNFSALFKINQPEELKVLNAHCCDEGILVFALNTNTNKKNLYMSGYSRLFNSIVDNARNWFNEIEELANEEIKKVIMTKKLIAILTEKDLYYRGSNDNSEGKLEKYRYFKEKKYDIEDCWLCGDYSLFKGRNMKNGHQCYLTIKKDKPKFIVTMTNMMEKNINFNMKLFIIMNKLIIIANQIPSPFPSDVYIYEKNTDDSEKNETVKFILTHKDEKHHYSAQLCNKNIEKRIYVFDIVNIDNKNQPIEEEEEEVIISSNSITNDNKWVIKEESHSQLPQVKDIMKYLLRFTQAIKHISQITLFIPESESSSTKSNAQDYFNLTLLGIFNANNANTNSLPEEIQTLFKTKSINIMKQFSDLKSTLIPEFIKAKDFYIHNKGNKLSFIEYLQSKYSNYDQFYQLSSETFIDKMEIIVTQLSSSIKFLMTKVNCLYDSFITSAVLSNLAFIPLNEQASLIKSFFETLKRRDSRSRIQISRGKALNQKNQGLKDVNYTWTLFCQMCDQMKKKKPSYYFSKKDEVLAEVDFLGENGTDAGGLGRELVDLAFSDLSSDSLDLFIPTPNNIYNSGNDRDKYTINPKCTGSRCIELYTFLGKMLIYIISSENYVPLPLTSFILKQILGIPLNPTDIEGIDVQAYNSIIKVLQSGSKEEKELLYDVLSFTCQLSNGQIIELIPNGENVKVNETNSELFLSLYLRVRYNECHEQIQAIRNGLLSYIPQNILKCLSWEKLEDMICGEEPFDLELLKKNTVYDPPYHSEDKTIIFFWKFLEECTLEEKYLYIKFIWGRTRLPKTFNFDSHRISKLHVSQDEVNKKLPIGHTCFFNLELPPYTTYNALKDKLMYAMKNAMVISDSESDLTFLS